MGEASQMSSMSEVSTATGGTEAGGDSGGSKTPMILVVLLLMVGVGAGAYFLLFAETKKVDEPTEDNGPSGPSGPGGPSGPSPSPSSPAKTPPPSDGTGATDTASTDMGTDTTDAGPAPVTAPVPATAAPAAHKGKMLACTYGSVGVLEEMVPPDGMCDVIFYTDVFFEETRKKIEPMDSTLAFDALKAKAGSYQTTTFGTSMYTGAKISEAVSSKKPDLLSAMGALFQEKMVHFGMLNVDKIEDYDELAQGTLKYLDIVKEFLAGKQPPPMLHCALGVGLSDGSKQQEILDKATSAATTFTGVTMVVIKVHTEKVNVASELHPVGPNPDSLRLAQYKMLSLAMISNGLKNRLEEISSSGQGGRYALLSFAMYARSYQMPSGWSDENNRDAATNTLKMDYALVCKRQGKADQTDTGSMFVANTGARFLALYDTVDTFKAKAEARVQSSLPGNFTGFMAYHVEMDDFDKSCGGEAFARLKAIKEELK